MIYSHGKTKTTTKGKKKTRKILVCEGVSRNLLCSVVNLRSFPFLSFGGYFEQLEVQIYILDLLLIAFVFSDCNTMMISSIYSFSTSFQSQLEAVVAIKKKTLSFCGGRWEAYFPGVYLGTNSFNKQKMSS